MGGSESKSPCSHDHEESSLYHNSRSYVPLPRTGINIREAVPSLEFHDVHGRHVQLSSDKKTAERVSSFCYGITFGDRPLVIGEKVHVKLHRIANSWSGVMRFGVTCNNPASLDPHSLPRYACPDLTNQPGYWAKALPDEFAVQDNVLSFHITHCGNIHLAVNHMEQGCFIGGIPTDVPLWMMADIYGNTTALRLLEDYLPNERRRIVLSNVHSHSGHTDADFHYSAAELEHDLRTVLYVSPFQRIVRTPFAPERGDGVGLFHDNFVASRSDDFSHESSLIFSGVPVRAGSTWYFKVISSSPQSFLSVGVTSCDPSSIDVSYLPVNSDDLMDRPEYWVVAKLSHILNNDDFLAVSLDPDGFLKYTSAQETGKNLFYCDISQQLWLVVDLSSNVESIASIGVVRAPLALPAEDSDSASDASGEIHISAAVPPDVEVSDVQLSPLAGEDEDGINPRSRRRGFLRGILGRLPHIAVLTVQQEDGSSSSSSDEYVNVDSDDTAPYRGDPWRLRYSLEQRGNAGVSDLAAMSINNTDETREGENAQPTSSGVGQGNSTGGEPTSNDCSICCEASANAAIYNCGHVCLCINCARRLVNSQRFPKCPICRNPIKDVMKLYMCN